MGYSSQKKGYKCYDPINHKYYISRDVTFLENEPYYKDVDNKIDNQEIQTYLSYHKLVIQL